MSKTTDKKAIRLPHPAFWRAASDASYALSVLTAFCTDDVIANELRSASEAIGNLLTDYRDMFPKNEDNKK